MIYMYFFYNATKIYLKSELLIEKIKIQNNLDIITKHGLLYKIEYLFIKGDCLALLQ